MGEPAPSPWKWYWKQDRRGIDYPEADCGIYYEPSPGHAIAICRAPRYEKKEQWEANAKLICEARDRIATLEEAAREAHAAWWRAENNRGCYSCVEEHDSRCCTNWKKPEPCNCGRVELDAAMGRLRLLAGKGEDGG